MAGKLPGGRSASIPDIRQALATLQAELVNPKGVIPDGFYSAREIAQCWGLSREQTGETLRRAVAANKAERISVRGYSGYFYRML